MNAICFVIDRLHAGYVGAYGNTWVDTPSLDRLASQSTVFDRALIDSPHLDRLYRSYWQGWHAMCPALPDGRPSLVALLRDAGIQTALLTDEPQVARHPLAVDFDQTIEIDPPWQTETAADVDRTHFAKCFVEIINWLGAARKPFLLWCHLGGLGSTWDAPLRFRQGYCEEGDPLPPETPEVPERMLPADCDPDELLGIRQSYAGQVLLLDACLGAMLEYLDGLPAGRETLLTLTSARGFPLGEHRRVGPCDDALFGELVQVPWMMRLPGPRDAVSRSQAMVEPADLWATLLDAWGIDDAPVSPTAISLLPIVRGQTEPTRDRLCVLGPNGRRAIRTPAWHLLTDSEPALYAKPDDRWEVNDVASRCREVAECLQDALMQYDLTLPVGRVSELPPLGDVLLHGLD